MLIFEADDVRASHRANVNASKTKRIFDHLLQKQPATNGIKSQHHRKATIYKTIVSEQPILAPGQHLSNASGSAKFWGTPQQNEQPASVDQSALIVLKTGRRPASFIKRPASFIKHEETGQLVALLHNSRYKSHLFGHPLTMHYA